MDKIIVKLRNLLKDPLKYNTDTFTYRGISKVFSPTENNVSSSTITVKINGTTTTAFTYSAITNEVTITATLVSNDVVRISYQAYFKYSDLELTAYIESAFTYLSVFCYKDFEKDGINTEPVPTKAEENLIALVSLMVVKGNTISSYRTPELTISFNDKDSLEDKIRKLIDGFQVNTGVFDYLKLSEYNIDFVDGVID
jgi:hypothetical protein